MITAMAEERTPLIGGGEQSDGYSTTFRSSASDGGSK